MTQMLRADGLVIVDRGQRLEPGEEVTVWVLGASKIQDDMIP
jgi:molybdopterin biosynthesis enzyme